ncbi:MAG: hypothetical protein K2H71_00710 [Muribaculaceae bacterium]|nr:hypothetical protein [Muribaculaceae bacterium]
MLFTPFFTTKDTGHGLGLLLVSEVLNSHGCRFSLETCDDGLTRIEGPGARLVITDNGPGISAEAAEMLFTPFFTTKDTGHGLGLLLVSEVLNSHGCRFSLETCDDGLTRFRIRFQ